MAEPSISLGYPDFSAGVGKFLGYGFDSTKWSAGQTAEVDQMVQSGYRQFLYPPPLQGKVYEWSFLKITADITTDGTFDYDCPENFGALLGDMTFNQGMGLLFTIQQVGEGVIRQKRQVGVVTTDPRLVAIHPKAIDGTTGQRFEFWFWPTPSITRTLTYRYSPLMNKLSTASPYPLGGAAHAETIMASCEAAAEIQIEDEKGIRWERFMERLTASINFDQRNRQQTFGYNADHSKNEEVILNRVQAVGYKDIFGNTVV